MGRGGEELEGGLLIFSQALEGGLPVFSQNFEGGLLIFSQTFSKKIMLKIHKKCSYFKITMESLQYVMLDLKCQRGGFLFFPAIPRGGSLFFPAIWRGGSLFFPSVLSNSSPPPLPILYERSLNSPVGVTWENLKTDMQESYWKSKNWSSRVILHQFVLVFSNVNEC